VDWRDILQARLLELRPASVVALDEPARRLVESVLSNVPIRMRDALADAPGALALGIDALNGLDVRQAQYLINRTRLYSAPRILLAVPMNCVLDEEMFRALGFMLSTPDRRHDRHIYYYDLDTYKTVPDWLNARHWAHPERWEP
jgi:hypothetical protein